jgi:hypothetical protein
MTAPLYRVEVIDLAVGRGEILSRELLTECRYARVPEKCGDCNGEVCTIPPGPGYAAALLRIHEETCPQFGSMALRAAS